jgi:hypothetical protein
VGAEGIGQAHGGPKATHVQAATRRAAKSVDGARKNHSRAKLPANKSDAQKNCFHWGRQQLILIKGTPNCVNRLSIISIKNILVSLLSLIKS